MPEVTKVNVIVGQRGSDLRLNDEVMLMNGRTGYIRKLKEGREYVTITLDDGNTGRLRIGSSQVVNRKVATKEEKVADEVNTFNAEWDKDYKQAEKVVNSLRATINKRWAAGGTTDYSDLQQLLTAEAEWKVWCHAVLSIEWMESKDKSVPKVRFTAAMLEQERSQVANQYASSPLSRSTSVISNIMEDVDKFAKQNWLRDRIKYSGFQQWAPALLIAEDGE